MIATTYADLLARLLPARRFGMVFGLERIRALLDALGSPDAHLGTVVHVGGTNGKGSTVAMIAALVRAAGLRVATYTSPHLSSLRERIAFDGTPIDERSLVAAAERVYAAGGDALTFFEQLTAIACVAIADAKVDVTVLEVGLGGRLDATNAIAAPIAVVTGVAMDHEAILGDTLAKIAAEKAGIFKPGQRVVIGASGEPAGMWLLATLARLRGAAVITEIGLPENHPTRNEMAEAVDDEMAVQRQLAEALQVYGRASERPLAGPRNPIDVRDDDAIARVPPLSLPGEHQRRNAAAALAAIDHLEALGVLTLDAEARARALAHVVHPGRFEIIDGTPRIILDGAHNPHGAAALAATLRERGERPTLILAVSADKDVRGIVGALAPAVRRIIATRYQQERALAPDALAAIAREHCDAVEVAPDLATADALARAHGDPIVIAGSLFVVGEARVRYLGAPADPVVVTEPPP